MLNFHTSRWSGNQSWLNKSTPAFVGFKCRTNIFFVDLGSEFIPDLWVQTTPTLQKYLYKLFPLLNGENGGIILCI